MPETGRPPSRRCSSWCSTHWCGLRPALRSSQGSSSSSDTRPARAACPRSGRGSPAGRFPRVSDDPVTVVLVHWNQPVRCGATIEAFQHQGVRVRVLVVDNGSDPSELARLRELVSTSSYDVALLELG